MLNFVVEHSSYVHDIFLYAVRCKYKYKTLISSIEQKKENSVSHENTLSYSKFVHFLQKTA